VLALAACSSPIEPASGGSGSGDPAASVRCVEDANAVVAKYRQPLQQPFPSPFDGRPVTGKSFWVISITQAGPSVVASTKGFAEAAEKVGAKAVIFDGKGSPDLFNQGVNSAVAAQAAGILLVGFDANLVKQSLVTAKSAGIPVISGLSGAPDAAMPDGVVGQVTFDGTEEGVLQANYAAVKTGCKVSGVMFYSQSSIATRRIADGAKAELQRICPETCTLDLQNVDSTAFATKLTSQAQNYLQRTPDVNFILTSSDSYVTYLLPAVKLNLTTTPVIGVTGDTLAAAQQGSGQTADILWPPLQMVGYMYFDSLMRSTVQQQETVVKMQLRLVDKSNWGADTSLRNLYPQQANYQSEYAQLWGAAP